MNEVFVPVLVVLLLGIAAVAVGTAAVSWWRERSAQPRRRAVADARGWTRQIAGSATARRPIRVLEIRPAAPRRMPQVRGRGSISAAAPVPDHALCTWCGRPVREKLEQHGGAVQCRDCGYFSHRRCFQEAGNRCGGTCQL